jgi:hypothetical protein
MRGGGNPRQERKPGVMESGPNDTRRRKAKCPHPPRARSTRPRVRGRTLHQRELFALITVVLCIVCVAALRVGGRAGTVVAAGALLGVVLLIFVPPLAEGGWFHAPWRARRAPSRRRTERGGGCGPA